MDQKDIEKLAKDLKNSVEEGEVIDFFQKNPRGILVARMALGLSQRELIKKMGRKISHPMLIRHETGNSGLMRKSLAESISKILPRKIKISEIISNHKKFSDMKKGYHMTPERARKLQKLSLLATTRKQRQIWGNMGAKKSNANQRLTEQERKISEVLKNLGFNFKTHQNIETNLIDMNVDFVIYKKNAPICFVEATERKHDMQILCQAYAYRSRVLKENFPNSKICILIKEIPLTAENILRNEFDFVSTDLKSFLKFLNRNLSKPDN